MFTILSAFLLFICAHVIGLNCGPIVLHPRKGGTILKLSQPAHNVITGKVNLYESCSVNAQCPNSAYCGLFEEFDSKICACKDGLMPSEDNSTCIIMHNCFIMGFNPDYAQGGCPQETQFCQQGVCKCKPGYEYNEQERCVWNVPDRDEPKIVGKNVRELKDYPEIEKFFKIQTNTTDNSNSNATWTWVQWIGVSAVSMAILVFLVMAVFLVLSFFKLMVLEDVHVPVKPPNETEMQPLQWNDGHNNQNGTPSL